MQMVYKVHSMLSFKLAPNLGNCPELAAAVLDLAYAFSFLA